MLWGPGLSLTEEGVLPMETPSTVKLAILGLELIERVPVLVDLFVPLLVAVAGDFLGSFAGLMAGGLSGSFTGLATGGLGSFTGLAVDVSVKYSRSFSSAATEAPVV